MFGRASIVITKTKRRFAQIGRAGFVWVAVLVAGCVAQQASPEKQPRSSLREAEGFIQKGAFEPARKLLEDQLKLNPSSVDAYNLLGIVYTNEKNYDHALDAFQQALKLAPNSTKTHNNLGISTSRSKNSTSRKRNSPPSWVSLLGIGMRTTT